MISEIIKFAAPIVLNAVVNEIFKDDTPVYQTPHEGQYVRENNHLRHMELENFTKQQQQPQVVRPIQNITYVSTDPYEAIKNRQYDWQL